MDGRNLYLATKLNRNITQLPTVSCFPALPNSHRIPAFKKSSYLFNHPPNSTDITSTLSNTVSFGNGQ